MSTAQVEAAAGTVIVGCKLPHGLTAELFVGKVGKDRRTVWRHTFKGANDSRIVGGYGLTDGVDAEKMKEWLKRNAELPAVRDQLIFIHTDAASARSHAKQGEGIRTGLEAIDPLDKSTQGKFKIDMDKEGEQAYRKQVAENPVRNRQIRE